MAMDSVHAACATRRSSCSRGTTSQTVRGVLHFVPCYGRPAVSLSSCDATPARPNGLTEFLVANGVELLKERGSRSCRELRHLREVDAQPEKRWERALAGSSRCSIRTSRSRACTASTRSSSRVGSPATSSTTAPSASRAPRWRHAREGQLPAMPSLPFPRPALRRELEPAS